MDLREMLFWFFLTIFGTGTFVIFEQHVIWGTMMIVVGFVGMVGCAWRYLKDPVSGGVFQKIAIAGRRFRWAGWLLAIAFMVSIGMWAYRRFAMRRLPPPSQPVVATAPEPTKAPRTEPSSTPNISQPRYKKQVQPKLTEPPPTQTVQPDRNCNSSLGNGPQPYNDVCEDVLADWLREVAVEIQTICTNEMAALVGNSERPAATRRNPDEIRLEATWAFDKCCLTKVQELHAGALSRFPWLRNDRYEYAIDGLTKRHAAYIQYGDLSGTADYFADMNRRLIRDYETKKDLQEWLTAPIGHPPVVEPSDKLRISQTHVATVHADAPFALTITLDEYGGKSGFSIIIECSTDVAYLELRGYPNDQRQLPVQRFARMSFLGPPEPPVELTISAEHAFQVVRVEMR